MHFLLNGFGPVVIEANDTEPRNDVFVIFGCYFTHKSLNERILASFCLYKKKKKQFSPIEEPVG